MAVIAEGDLHSLAASALAACGMRREIASKLGPLSWLAGRMEDFAAILHETRAGDAGRPVMLPGEIELAKLERQRRDGIEIDDAVLAWLSARSA